MSEFRVAITIVGASVCLFILVVGGLTFGGYLIGKNITCPAFGQATERPHRYSLWAGGCFVQTAAGQWVRSGNYWNAIPGGTGPRAPTR